MADYYSRVNETLLNLIPLSAETILEVGCGTGALAKRYKMRNPGCRYFGIEASIKDPGDVDPAIESLYLNKVEDQPNMFRKDLFDCLIFGDVLEHMEDPLAQLKKCVGWLKEGGQALACIPNIGHYSAIVHLLQQKWVYTDEGLLDRTHSRFFTKDTAMQMFKDAGLTVFEVVPRRFGNEHFDSFMKAIEVSKSTWEKFGVDIDKLKDEAAVYQWVVRAIKGEASGNKVLIRSFGGPACCERPRLTEPGIFLNTIPGVRYSQEPTAVRERESVVVIRQRAKWDLAEVRSHIKNGFVIVGEWDDEPELVAKFEKMAAPLDLALRGCHAIQTSTERMAETLRKWNPEVAVFPNQIAELPPPRKYSEKGPVRIFFGAQNRESDWKPIMPALNRVLQEYGDRVFVEVVQDRDFYNALEVKPGKQKSYRPFLPYDKYREVLRRCDIALLPLEPTEFNEHKSDIKFLECAAEGVAVWAQHTVYFETIYGQPDQDDPEMVNPMGQVSESPLGFESDLRILIDHTDYRRILARRAYEYVRDHRMLKDHYIERLGWYLDLASRKAEFDEALKLRAPELFEESH